MVDEEGVEAMVVRRCLSGDGEAQLGAWRWSSIEEGQKGGDD